MSKSEYVHTNSKLGTSHYITTAVKTIRETLNKILSLSNDLHISRVSVNLRRVVDLPVKGSPAESVLGAEFPRSEVRETDWDAAANGLRPVHG